MLRRNPGQAARLGTGTTFVVTLLALAAFAAVAGIGHLQATANAQKTAPPKAEQQDQTKTDLQSDPLPAGASARMGTIRWRHGDTVNFVAFSGEGKGVVTASQDGTIRLWDRETGKEIRRFKDPSPQIFPPAPALSWDGKVLAAAYANEVVAQNGGFLVGDQGIQLWDVATGKEFRQIQGLPTIAVLLFAPDGKTLVGQGRIRCITYLWETETGNELRRFQGSKYRQKPDRGGLAISADGKTLATADVESDQNKKIYLKLTDLNTGKERRKIDKTGVYGIAYSPNGQLLAYGSGNNIFLCEADTLKEIRQISHQDGISAPVFAPDGKTLAAKGRDQVIRLWQTDTGKELQQFGAAVPLGGGNGVVFSPFGNPKMCDFAFSLDGKILAAGAGHTLRMWEVGTSKELPLTGGHRGGVSSLTITPDGKTLVTRSADNVIARWDLATGKELGQLPAPAGTTSATFAPDGQTVALCSTDASLRLFEVKTGKFHNLKGPANGTTRLAFSPNGKILASRGKDNTIHLYDMARGGDLRQMNITTDKDMVYAGGYMISGSFALVFSPDGETLVAHVPGTNPKVRLANQTPEPGPDTLRLWDVATGKELRRIKLPQPGTLSLAYSPDGRVLATENADQTISLWEIASGKERGRFGKPNPTVRPGAVNYFSNGSFVRMAADSSGTLAFSPDGRLLAAKGPANAVSVWDVVGGKTLGQFKGHDGAIAALAFAPDGKSLASGSNDTTALVWDLAGLKREPKLPTVALEAGEVQTLWNDLLGTDAAKAGQGILRLAQAPRQTVALLSKQLKPAVPVDPKVLDQLIADLNSKNFQTRNKATAELEKLGELAVPALQEVLLSSPSLETQRRVEVLLEKLTGGNLTAEQIRLVRAVEVLERLGTVEGQQVLRTLANGAPGALATRQAQAALKRTRGK